MLDFTGHGIHRFTRRTIDDAGRVLLDQRLQRLHLVVVRIGLTHSEA